MFLSELKTTDFKKKQKYTFVVSLGATEQHGPFLPLGTDTYCHDAIIQRAEKKLRQVIFLPTLPISCSEEHRGFAGTVWMQKETLYLVLQDIGDSLQEYAKHIIFVSWHGGNLSLLDSFVAAQQKKHKKIKLVHVRMEDAETDKKTRALVNGPIDEHAGNTEISMVLATHPRLVTKPNSKKHPKHAFDHDWENTYVIDTNPDGIVDTHPEWVVSKKIGEACIDMHARLLVREVKRVCK
jgi:creatinine amidohydrolase